MKNHVFGSRKIVRSDGTRVLSNAFFDRGYDPFEVFDLSTLAMRRDAGDIRFVAGIDRQAVETGRLFLAPEFPSNVYNEPSVILSLILGSLNSADFLARYEVTNADPHYRVLPWTEGMRRLREKAGSSKDILESDMMRKLEGVDAISPSALPHGEIRKLVGPETGARYELSLM